MDMKSINQRRDTGRSFIAIVIALIGVGLMWYLKPQGNATYKDIALLAPASFFVTLFAYYGLSKGLNKYYACPYCNQSVLMDYKWQCDSCNTVQSKPKLLSDPCEECLGKQETAFCDSCEKEFII